MIAFQNSFRDAKLFYQVLYIIKGFSHICPPIGKLQLRSQNWSTDYLNI